MLLLSTYGGRDDVEPLVGLAVGLRALGTQVRVCAPPDWAERLAEVGVPLLPVGEPVRPLLHRPTPASAPDAPRRAAESIAEQFGPVGQSVARSGHQVRSAGPDALPRALVHATATRS